MNKLNKKTAIITGGSSGIGLATAKLFLEEGANVVIVSRNAKRAEAELSTGKDAGNKTLFINADVSSEESCRQVITKTISTFGKVNVLFNGAGVIFVNRTVVDTPEEEWRETIDVNLKGTFLMSKCVIPEMIKIGGGSIINTSSIYGLVGGAGCTAYCVAKGGVTQMTRAMAVDHAAQNVRVNCICPGSVDTPMLRKEMDDLGGVDKMWSVFAAKHPMNRISTAEENARAVLFLASDDSSFITGVALPIDGGRSAW
jgi:NAD(P)-dependent dehydrogenase (short-subunit alcohol dehydrogenase family)